MTTVEKRLGATRALIHNRRGALAKDSGRARRLYPFAEGSSLAGRALIRKEPSRLSSDLVLKTIQFGVQEKPAPARGKARIAPQASGQALRSQARQDVTNL